EPHRASLIYNLGLVALLLGIPGLCGILCLPMVLSAVISAGLGVATWLIATRDLQRMSASLMDPQGLERTRMGKYYAIAGMALGGFSILLGAAVQMVNLGMMFP